MDINIQLAYTMETAFAQLCSDYASSRFIIISSYVAWTIWFAIRKWFSAVAPEPPCCPIFHDTISKRGLLSCMFETRSFESLICRFCLNWPFLMAMSCKFIFIHITMNYHCQASIIAGVGFEPTTFSLWGWRASRLLHPASFQSFISSRLEGW